MRNAWCLLAEWLSMDHSEYELSALSELLYGGVEEGRLQVCLRLERSCLGRVSGRAMDPRVRPPQNRMDPSRLARERSLSEPSSASASDAVGAISPSGTHSIANG